MKFVRLQGLAFCLAILAVSGFLFFFVSPASADEIDCLMCHADLAGKKVKHAAVDMGCPSCHTAVDAADVPHKMKNKIKKGLSSEQPELCYGCHDKALFTNKTVHAAVGMGCTGCHNPHSSDSPKLLVSAAPDLCYTCHDKAEFSRKNVHAPVAGGNDKTILTRVENGLSPNAPSSRRGTARRAPTIMPPRLACFDFSASPHNTCGW